MHHTHHTVLGLVLDYCVGVVLAGLRSCLFPLALSPPFLALSSSYHHHWLAIMDCVQ